MRSRHWSREECEFLGVRGNSETCEERVPLSSSHVSLPLYVPLQLALYIILLQYCYNVPAIQAIFASDKNCVIKLTVSVHLQCAKSFKLVMLFTLEKKIIIRNIKTISKRIKG